MLFTDRKKLPNLSAIKFPKTVIIRDYDLPSKARRDLAQNFRQSKIIIGKDLALAHTLKADGVHFSDFDRVALWQLSRLSHKKNTNQKFQLSFSCHNFSFLRKILTLSDKSPSMIFISPIFSTTSHQNQKPLGLAKAAKLIRAAKKIRKNAKIYALGGVKSTHLRALKKLGFAGFGAIDYFKNNA